MVIIRLFLVIFGRNHDFKYHNLLEKLRPVFNGYFLVETEYEYTFYIWERLKSLIFGYNKYYILDIFSIPLGNFTRSEIESKFEGLGEDPYTIFWDSADTLKNEWPPIKQGMFDGSYENYKEINDKVKTFVNEHASYR